MFYSTHVIDINIYNGINERPSMKWTNFVEYIVNINSLLSSFFYNS